MLAGATLTVGRQRSSTSLPLGVAGLIFARLVLGAGEGVVYTAGSAWVVDITDPARRGRIIGLYGLAIWGGLSFGPPIGDLLLRALELRGRLGVRRRRAAARRPDRQPDPGAAAPRPLGRVGGPLAAVRPRGGRPGLAMTLATLGYAALAGFVVLHLDERGIGHGAAIFTAFAVTVVAARVLAGWLPDRYGAVRCAVGRGDRRGRRPGHDRAGPEPRPSPCSARSPIGAAFSLMFPSLVLLVVNRVDEDRRGVAMGTFTACFDLGVGLGAPIAGVAAALGGYGALVRAWPALAALGASVLALPLGRRIGGAARRPPACAPARAASRAESRSRRRLSPPRPAPTRHRELPRSPAPRPRSAIEPARTPALRRPLREHPRDPLPLRASAGRRRPR